MDRKFKSCFEFLIEYPLLPCKYVFTFLCCHFHQFSCGTMYISCFVEIILSGKSDTSHLDFLENFEICYLTLLYLLFDSPMSLSKFYSNISKTIVKFTCHCFLVCDNFLIIERNISSKCFLMFCSIALIFDHTFFCTIFLE